MEPSDPETQQAGVRPILPPRVKNNAKFSDLFEGQTAEEALYAEMTRAVYVRYNEGVAKANSFAADNVGNGYTIDTDLSTRDALVFTRGIASSPDDIVVAFRVWDWDC